eukprot:6204980-Pleurochrysis_carterae.AAC.2
MCYRGIGGGQPHISNWYVGHRNLLRNARSDSLVCRQSINTPLAGEFPARERPKQNRIGATDNESGADSSPWQRLLDSQLRVPYSHVFDARLAAATS